MMKKIQMTLAALVLLGSSLMPAMAANGPKVVQRSLVLNVEDRDHYWPDPKKDPVFDKAAWMPMHPYLHFVLEGPLPADSELWMEFFKPDGKSWIKIICLGAEDGLGASKVADINCNTIDEHLVLPMVGTFGFKIYHENKKKGIHDELFKGRFKVDTYVGKDSKQLQHGIDEDWRVPLAFLLLDEASEPNTPPLYAYFWFKHRTLEFSPMKAELFYKGKKIATHTDNSNNAELITDRRTGMDPVDPKKDFSYQLWNFNFSNVRGTAPQDEEVNEDWHVLDRNPGNYEIKVFYDGKPVRTAGFTVDAKGKISAPGSVEKDSNGNNRILIPTQVLGNVDMPWNKTAYQTEIYYGNPSPTTSGILKP